MVLVNCPMCSVRCIKVHTKSGFGVDFDIKKSNQNTICPNCKRKISFSVVKIEEKH